MAKKKIERIRELVRITSPEVLLRAAALCDGHSIFDPQAFLNAGLHRDIVDHLTITHHSDSWSPKSMIYRDGMPQEAVSGVYGLDLLEFIADALGVKHLRCMGRGFQAAAIQDALYHHFNSAPPAAPGGALGAPHDLSSSE